jgi:DNA-binding transcriptional LysR family regulator
MVNFATLDLNLLRALNAILREGSTTKAGERLGVSQSAVSNALNRLRHSLGDDLFVRQGNRLVPTDYAASIEAGLRDGLGSLENLVVRRDFDPSTAHGAFRIAAGDYFSETLMPQLSARLSKVAQGLLIHHIAWEPNDHLIALEQGTADLGLGPLLTPLDSLPAWINVSPLLSARFVGIADQNNPLLRDIPDHGMLPLDRYFEATHVLFSVAGELESFEDDVLASLGRERRVAMTAPSFAGMFRAVGKSHHLGIAPEKLALRLASQYGLRTFEVPFELDEIQVYATWHKRSDRNPLAQWIRGQVFELVGAKVTHE